LLGQNGGPPLTPNQTSTSPSIFTPPTPNNDHTELPWISTPSVPTPSVITTPTPSVEYSGDSLVYLPPPPKKVYIVGSYDQQKWLPGAEKGVTLGDTIQNFSGTDTKPDWNHGTALAAYHNDDKTNDAALKELFSKMSDEDKKISFKGNESAYVIDEDGKILDKIGASQIVDKAALSTCPPSGVNFTPGGTGANVNSSFSILEDLGVDKTHGYHDSSMYYDSIDYNNAKGIANLEEATGGKIKLGDKEYEVITTVIRKDTPLTFDLNGDGVKTSDKMTQYDIDGDGTIDNINDVADGTLTIRGGASGKDLFGNNTDLDGDGKADGFKDGFEALKALALKEGLIDDQKDMVLDASDLTLLEKKYQLGMKTVGYHSR
jgi:hypothetical protein